MKQPICDVSPRYRVEDIPDFDFARHLDSEEMIAAYLDAVLEDNDMDLLISALGDVARARGMTQVAEDAGVSREALYRALKKDKKPRSRLAPDRAALAIGAGVIAAGWFFQNLTNGHNRYLL